MILQTLTIASMLLAPAKGDLRYSGYYVEGCSCSPPCACELTGIEMGCQGVGGFMFSSGTYSGVDISGSKLAYAVVPGEWIVLYVDAPTAAKRNAVSNLGKAAFKDWGKMAPIQNGKISIMNMNGKYTLKVNDGKVMMLTTQPVFGGDKKTPITLSNINDVLHPVIMQGKTIKCTYNDLGHSFELENSNAYFNSNIKVKASVG